MKKEVIRDAARYCVKKVCRSEIDYSSIGHFEDNSEAGRNDSLMDFGILIFEEGVKWRIDSVWHKMNEKPDFEVDNVMVFFDGGVSLCYLHDYEDICKRKYCIAWAYIMDLLPNLAEK